MPHPTIPDNVVRQVRVSFAHGTETIDQLSQRFGIPVQTIGCWTRGYTRRAAGGPIVYPGTRRPGRPDIAGLYVEDAEGCWVWKGYLNSAGYGQIKRDGVNWLAHRYSWFLRNGDIPEGLTVDHLCFKPACVNPHHLRLLTPSDNSKNKRITYRTHCFRGHELKPANVKYYGIKKVVRICVACQRIRTERQEASRRLARVAAKAV